MQSPKLTYLINKVDYGGAEIGMVRLLSGLPEDTFDCTVVTLKSANPELVRELPESVDIHELQFDDGPTVDSMKRLRSVISDTDILVCSLFPSIVVGSVLGSIERVPKIYVWRHNTSDLSWYRVGLNKISIRFSDGVFTDSEATRKLVSEWGVDDQGIHVLPLSGVHVDEYPTVEHRNIHAPIRIGTVGRLVEQKGYPELIDCAKHLPEYEFHIVGDGPLANSLEKSPENVIKHGQVDQDELDRLWGSFDVYFQPSRHEGLCITAIEGMACGLPVVASQVDGLTESIVQGETGYLVEQGDIEGYCSRIEELARDPEKRQRFGRNGLARVRSQYSRDALAQAFTENVLDPSHEVLAQK